MLARLYADAARRIADSGDLSDLTAAPPASQQEQLRAALAPAVQRAPEEGAPRRFTGEFGGQDYGERLRQAFLDEIDNDEVDLVIGKGQTERAQPGKLYSISHIQQIADLVRTWVNEVFGKIVAVPRMVVANPGQQGDIYDHFTYRDHEWLTWTPGHFVKLPGIIWARCSVVIDPNGKPAIVTAEHGANVSFVWPLNDETKIANDVIDRLLDDPKLVRRINEIERGWGAGT